MVGDLLPGPRAKQQFVSVDRKGEITTYSRSCTVEGVFVLVRVAHQHGKPHISSLGAADRRFVEHNITPGEHKALSRGRPRG